MSIEINRYRPIANADFIHMGAFTIAVNGPNATSSSLLHDKYSVKLVSSATALREHKIKQTLARHLSKSAARKP